jgi:hypothetical protein
VKFLSLFDSFSCWLLSFLILFQVLFLIIIMRNMEVGMARGLLQTFRCFLQACKIFVQYSGCDGSGDVRAVFHGLSTKALHRWYESACNCFGSRL